MNEKLLYALEHISDEHIAQAATRRKKHRPYWIGTIAAILAVTILSGVFLSSLGNSDSPAATEPTITTIDTTKESTPSDEQVQEPAPELSKNGIAICYDMVGDIVTNLDLNGTLSRYSNAGLPDHYSVNIYGLCTPIQIEMKNMDVVSIQLYDFKLDWSMPQFQEEISLTISQWGDTIVLKHMEDVCLCSWIVTPEQHYAFYPDYDLFTEIYVDSELGLRYQRYIGAYMTTLNQDDFAPITLFNSRDAFVYEEGTCTIDDEQAMVTQDSETYYTISDLYDLDAIFANAKAQGMFPEYDTLDDYFAAKAFNIEWNNNATFQEHINRLNAPLDAFYEVTITNLFTPVTLQMNGRELQSIQVYGHWISGPLPDSDNSVEHSLTIIEYQDSLIFQVIDEQCIMVWIVTPDTVFNLEPSDTFTQFYKDENGQLRYVAYVSPYPIMDQLDFPQLTLFNSRDDFFYDEGAVTLTHDSFDLTIENTYTISDVYDLDAIFAEAQAVGMYLEYDSVDALFDERKNSSTEMPEDDLPEQEVTAPPEDVTQEDQPFEENDSYLLSVFGTPISEGKYMVFNDDPSYVVLPLTAVLEALGADIQQTGDGVFRIRYDDETYILDTGAVSFVKEESSINYIIPAPGGSVHHQMAGNVFLLDHVTVRTIANAMGIKISILTGSENHTVEIVRN